MAGELAAALTAAVGPVVAQVVTSLGSTCAVRRPTDGRAADKTRTRTWAAAGTVPVVLLGLSAHRAQQVYGADVVAEREGILQRSAGVRLEDVLRVSAGPFAGEQLRVVAFADEVPMGDALVVALARDTQAVGG